MIPLEKRDKCRCYFCGAKQSVKYIVEMADPLQFGEKMSVYACNKCALMGSNNSEKEDTTHTYCQLANGTFVSKARVDRARELLDSLMDGFTVTELTDDELFTKGDKVEAIMRYRKKYNCGIAEAKATIERLRGENE